ncbi:MAG: alpha-L-fucosidase [Candidatus Omnitrophica bacterium]|nr:alpha-L-fucosidase [Candidatus Omnitrophota bacterium]
MRDAILCAVFLIVLGVFNMAQAKEYEPNWESLDSRPTPEWFRDAKFGIFIHWGVYSVPAWGEKKAYSEWYWHNAFNADGTLKDNPWGEFHRKNYGEDFPYSDFAPLFKAELYDPAEWADIFKRAGAKYVVPTSKHHDGFCMWPSEEANKTWGRQWNAVDIGPHRDLLGDLAKAVREADLKFGFYYSMYEWYNPLWLNDKPKYIKDHMTPQFKDVVTRYAPSLIFSDGEWDLPPEEWGSPELVAWLYNESPSKDELIVNDRWGKGARHHHGGYYTTEYGAGLANDEHPWEESRGIGFSYGYNRNEPWSNYRSPKDLILNLVDLVSRGGNFLLDIGPDSDGRIPMIMQDRLLAMGDWLAVNGEAIYGTRPWKRTCQWSEGEQPKEEYGEYRVEYNILKGSGFGPTEDGKAVKEIFFTHKPGVLYAILPGWPDSGEMVIQDFSPKENPKVTLLGVEGELKTEQTDKGLRVTLPNLHPEEPPCRYAYTIRIEGVE